MYERKRVNTLAKEYEQVLDIYEVDKYGNVYGADGKELKKCFNSSGYYQVALKIKNKRKWKKCFVHRLVGYGFVKGHSEINNIIDHIDTNKLNNVWTNLRWGTQKDNMNNEITLSRIKEANGHECFVYDFRLNFVGKFNSMNDAQKTIGRAIKGLNTRVAEYYILAKPDLSIIPKINKRQKLQSIVITDIETYEKKYFYSNRQARRFFDNKVNITNAIQKNWTVRGKYKVRALNYKKLIGMLDL